MCDILTEITGPAADPADIVAVDPYDKITHIKMTAASFYFLAAFLLHLTTVTCMKSQCPKHCICSKELHVVRCERQKLLDVPDGLPVEATELYLGYNLITSLEAKTFSNLSNLHTLSLKGNKLLTSEVSKDALFGLNKLKYLFLTDNRLTSLDKEVFQSLSNLLHIYISQNALVSIPDMSHTTMLTRLGLNDNNLANATFPQGFTSLLKLNTVDLSNNPKITKLTDSDLHSLKNAPIKKLSFSRCGLTNVSSNAFRPLIYLTSLTLSYTDLTMTSLYNIFDSLNDSLSLQSLDVSGVIKDKVIPWDILRGLKQLPIIKFDMSHTTNVDVIRSGTFSPLTKIQYLNLEYSQFEIIQDGAFSGVDTLTRLNLNYNHLKNIPISLPQNMIELELINNIYITKIEDFTFKNLGKLKNLTLAGCSIISFGNDAFTGLGNLRFLDLSRNRIAGTSIGSAVFHGLPNLNYLLLNRNNMRMIKTEYTLFSDLQNLTVLDFSDNLCSYLPERILDPLVRLQSLYMRNNQMGEILNQPQMERLFSRLVALKELDLSINTIDHLPSHLLQNLTSMTTLKLSENSISSWSPQFFNHSKSLTLLNMSDNQITIVNSTDFSGLSPIRIDLSRNPFNCWCDLTWFRNWMDTLKNLTQIKLVGYESYKCHSPEDMASKNVLEFHPQDIDRICHQLPWLYILLSVIAGVVLVMLTSIVTVYKYRWPLRLWWYQVGRRPHSRGSEMYESLPGTVMCHDILISYGPSDEDIAFVRDVLFPHFDKDTKRQWQLFFEMNDVQPNQCPIGEIAEAIYHSGKIIIVISNAYLKNGRRQLEVEQALASVSERGVPVDSIVVLVVLHSDLKVRIPRALHPILSQELELDWTSDSPEGQELFFKKLHERLEVYSQHSLTSPVV